MSSYVILISVIFMLISLLAANSDVKIDVISNAIAQIIDHMSDEYHMRFTLISTGNENFMKELANEIMSSSKSIIYYEHHETADHLTIIDYDESQVILTESLIQVLSPIIDTTQRLTYRKTFILIFDINFFSERMSYVVQNKQKSFSRIPHDIHQLAHSPEDGSMWLMANELFFNGTCETFYHPINFFNSSTMMWRHDKFVNEYKTFHKCQVLVESEIDDSRTREDWKSNIHLESIVRTFADKHNMTLEYQIFSGAQYLKINFTNGSPDPDEHERRKFM